MDRVLHEKRVQAGGGVLAVTARARLEELAELGAKLSQSLRC
jgi:hypothetical protein